jgi:hypothetical protein
MKNANKIITWIAGLALTMIITQTTFAQPGYGVNFQVFYNELDPYGSWIEYPGYGYVWSPNVGYDFRPYGTNGYWVATEYGNTWVSNYSWGWAPFHYGRWTFDNYYGWLWIPGHEWAPAWVAWRSGGGYYGWAPLGPNININVSFNQYIPDNYWVFVPQQHICGNGISNYYVQPRHVVNIIHNTVIIKNIHHDHHYFTGPSVREMSRARGRSVEVYAVNNDNKPGRTTVRNRSVDIYRPQVESSKEQVRPAHVTKRDDSQKSGFDRNNARGFSRDNAKENIQQDNSQGRTQRDDSRRMQQDNNNNHSVQPAITNDREQPSRSNDHIIERTNRNELSVPQSKTMERKAEPVRERQTVDQNRSIERQTRDNNIQRQNIETRTSRDLNAGQRQVQERNQHLQEQHLEMHETERQQNSRSQNFKNPDQQPVKPSVEHNNGHNSIAHERKR